MSIPPEAEWRDEAEEEAEEEADETVSGRILVVDPDPAVAARYRAYLIEHGYQIRAAYTAADALSQIEQGMAQHAAPQLLFIDKRLSRHNDCALLHRIRSRLSRDRLTIIVLTTTPDGNSHPCYEDGIDYYMAKVVNPVELQVYVRRCIDYLRKHPQA